MSEDDHVTHRELGQFRELLDERLRRTETKFLLYLGIAVGLIRLDIPTPVTAGAIALMCVKGLTAFIGRF